MQERRGRRKMPFAPKYLVDADPEELQVDLEPEGEDVVVNAEKFAGEHDDMIEDEGKLLGRLEEQRNQTEAEDALEGKRQRALRRKAQKTNRAIEAGVLLPDGTPVPSRQQVLEEPDQEDTERPQVRSRPQKEAERERKATRRVVKRGPEDRGRREGEGRVAPGAPVAEEMAFCTDHGDLEALLDVYDQRADEFLPEDLVSCLTQVKLVRDAIFKRKRVTKVVAQGITTPMSELLQSTQTPEQWEVERRARIKEFPTSILFAHDLVRDQRFRALTTQLLEVLGDGGLEPPLLAEVTSSYSLLGIHSSDLYTLIAKTATSRLETFGSADLVKFFSSFATAKLKSQKFVSLVLKRAEALAPDFTPQEHIDILYSAALFGLPLSASLLQTLLASVGPSVETVEAPALCRLMWALSVNRSATTHSPQMRRAFFQVYPRAAFQVVRRGWQCGATDLVLALNGLSLYSPPTLSVKIWTPIVHRAASMIPTFKVAEVVDFLDSITKLGIHLPSAFASAKGGIENRLHLFTGDELVTLVGAYSTVSGQQANFLQVLLAQLSAQVTSLPPASLMRLPRRLAEAKLRHPLLSDIVRALPPALRGLEEQGKEALGKGLSELLWGFAGLGLRLDDALVASCLSRLTPRVVESLSADSAGRLAWALAVFQSLDVELARKLFDLINRHAAALTPEWGQVEGANDELLSEVYQAHLYAVLAFPEETIKIHSDLQVAGRNAYLARFPPPDVVLTEDVKASLAHQGLASDTLQDDIVPLGLGIRARKTLLAVPPLPEHMVYDAASKQHADSGEEFLRRSICRLLNWRVIPITLSEWVRLKTREAKTTFLREAMIEKELNN